MASPASPKKKEGVQLKLSLGMLTTLLAIAGLLVLFTGAGLISIARTWVFGGSPPNVIRMPPGEMAVFNGDEAPNDCVGQIVFPRDHIVACEGYWSDEASAAVGANSGTKEGGLPFPQRRPLPFCGQQQWAKRLAYIEAKAMEAFRADKTDFAIQVRSFRGLSTSRLTGELLGNKEFIDVAESPRAATKGADGGAVAASDRRVCWTGDLRDHYVEGHNVVPSRDFYFYVLERYASLARD